MAKPGLRNKGESLAEKIDKTRHTDNLSAARDRITATRARQAKGWEAAAEAVDRAASNLAERADQVRVEASRADQLSRFASDVRKGEAKAPQISLNEIATEPAAHSRYHLICLDCEWDIRPNRPEPRVPLCRKCKEKREARRVADHRAKMDRQRRKAARKRGEVLDVA